MSNWIERAAEVEKDLVDKIEQKDQTVTRISMELATLRQNRDGSNSGL